MTTITCPSGMVIDIRELTGRDGRYLTNPKLVRDNEVEDFILKSCSTLVEPGPYESKFRNGVIDWQKVLIGDRAYTFVAVREETFPSSEEKFFFKVPCANQLCKAHEKPFDWGIDLAQFLKKKTKVMTPENAAIFASTNRFATTVPFTKDNRKLYFKLKTGEDSKRFALFLEQRNAQTKKKQEEANRLLDSLVSSIIEIEGVTKNRASIIEYLEGLSFRSIDALLPAIQEPDCGLETTIRVACPRCTTKRSIDLPLDRTFFLPKSSKRLEESSDVSEDDDEEEMDGEATPLADEPDQPTAE